MSAKNKKTHQKNDGFLVAGMKFQFDRTTVTVLPVVPALVP